MKQKRICKLSSLLLALVMLVSLAVPAFADDPVRELRMQWLDWDEDGRCYAGEQTLSSSNGDGANALNFAPGRGDHVIFFIWNNRTQRKEKFVVPQSSKGLRVVKVDAEGIAKDAKQSQYYVRLEMDGWNDADLTADGLTFHVTAAMNDFAFFSAQTFSQAAYLANEVNEAAVTDRAVYFGSSYAGTEEASQHDAVVSVEKNKNGHENLYTLEKAGDGCWKIVFQDVFDNLGDIRVSLKLELRDPDGNTREEYSDLRIYREYAPELWFVNLDGQWNDEADRDDYFFNPERGGTSRVELQPGWPTQGLFGYGAYWDEDGELHYEDFTPVAAKDLKLPEGVAVTTGLPATEDAKWSEYYVELSVDETDKDYTVTSGEYELTINSRLPSDIGVYSAPQASWDAWLGNWGFPYTPTQDNVYYLISTADDARDGRHLTGMALSADWDRENHEIANDGAELSRLSDGVYELKLKDSALNHEYFHLDLDITWTDMMGNTWTDTNRYIGNFDPKFGVVASGTALLDGTSISPANLKPVSYGDAADQVSTNVVMKAGEDKEVYLYRIGLRWSEDGSDWAVFPMPYRGYFHADGEELTLTSAEDDPTKFTLSCGKPGVYEIFFGYDDYDWANLALYHADGTAYTQEEMAKFDELYWSVEEGVFVVADPEDRVYVPFEERFPGDTYELEYLGLYDPGWYRLTVTVEPSFTDVAEGDWFYSDVTYAAVNGMMGSDSATGQVFNPNGKVTRQMVPTVLHRLDGRPEASDGGFSDVAAGAWYADAVNWGAEAGVVKGMGDGSFGVDSAISREQLVTMLYRYAQYKGCDMSASDDLSAFPDAKDVSDWALKEMQWAVGAGIINGKGGNLVPQGGASRAELATMLARFCRDVL